MSTPFDSIATRSRTAWAQAAVTYTPVDVAAYELVFRQAGVVLPAELRAWLAHGAFAIAPCDSEPDDESYNLFELELERAGDRGFDLVMKGLHLLTPDELFATYRSQQAPDHLAHNSLWVFASPTGYLWTDAYAFDTRFANCIIDFHEDGIFETLELAGDAPAANARPTLDAWARELADTVVATVAELDLPLASSERRAPRPTDLDEYRAQIASGAKRWSSYTQGIWSAAIQRGTVDDVRRVLEHVGTVVTNSKEADYRLPSPIDLLHRFPSKRGAFFAMIGHRYPERGELAPAYDWLASHLVEDAPAPIELFDELTAIGWASRRPSNDPDVRWARALLWALGPAIPGRLYEAARLISNERGRAAVETAWLRLEAHAKELGVV